ncbi:hypothetical protein JX265_003108 [Neoarthrinium moseri]|uniref:Protein kinase domain-containing protein n=1 Tax=Neoarthrinium moseri TaxID=1658444 RepID=A0A9P9WT99_9PEZI|nr:hypothetical protein JX265_003108 [Neoarthrinium moseri]
MTEHPAYQVAAWMVHDEDDDGELEIRTNNGRTFYCSIDPNDFQRSPNVKEAYMRCLNLLRSGDLCTDDGFSVNEALDSMLSLFSPLVCQLAPLLHQVSLSSQTTLAQYLYAPMFFCGVKVVNEKVTPYTLKELDYGLGPRSIFVRREPFLKDLSAWTRCYTPEDVVLSYDRVEDILIKYPRKVVVVHENQRAVTCFYKPCEGSASTLRELKTFRKLKVASASNPLSAGTRFSRLHGIVVSRDGKELFGMLFYWINIAGLLSPEQAAQTSAERRQSWARDMKRSVKELHARGIVWGDVKAANVLIDTHMNLWITDFGGGCTPGWVDREKAGTIEGDWQGLAKILSFLE